MKPEDKDNNMKNESNQQLSLKQFCLEVAEARKINPHNVYMNMRRGVWPWPEMDRVNQRLILIKTSVEEYLSKLSSYKSNGKPHPVDRSAIIKGQARCIRRSLQTIAVLTGRQATGKDRTASQSRVMVRMLKDSYKLEEVFK